MAEPQAKRAAASSHPHWGRRKRRLRRTAAILGAVAVVGAGIGLAVHLTGGPEVYRPGEANPEITRKLARELPEGAPVPQLTDVTEAAGLGGFRTFAGERTSQLPEDMGSGAAWGDYDNDGDDDLMLVAMGGALTLPVEERAPSQLYENRGDGTFRRVTSFPDLRILGMAAAWGDYDGDGWLDLVITGYNSLLLLRNQRGELIPDTRFPDRQGYWAGASWGDFDNDRDLDLYVCGYVRYIEETGEQRRMSQQYGAAVPYTLNPSTYEPAPNLLFRNNGDGTFTEVAEQMGVANPEGRSLSALWHDFDDDGWLELYVANDVSDNVLYRNRGGSFEDASHASWVADYRGAMGLAAGDWNRDGDDDLFITHWVAQENALYDSLWADLQKRDPNQAPGGDRKEPHLGFTDVAAPTGLGQIALRMVGWGNEFGDFDGDGWLDLVVINGSTFETDEEPRQLKPQEPFFLWNQQGKYFHDLAPLNETLAVARVGRGLALSDYDRDGDLDLLIVHLDGGAQLLRNEMQTGNWIQVRLRSGSDGSSYRGVGEGAQLTAWVGDTPLRRSLTGYSFLSQSSRTVHFGLGEAAGIDRIEVRWPAGEVETYAGLEANATWELTEGDTTARKLAAPSVADARQRLAQFWELQRSAMDAMKRDNDIPRATELFRQALELNPAHEDARYYLGNCLAVQGDVQGALEQLEELIRVNPQSHRAYKQWGLLRTLSAQSEKDLDAAEASLEKALALNPEETGSLLMLGELAVIRGDHRRAEDLFERACLTNPRAVGGFFLRAYVAWKDGEEEEARSLLRSALEARGEQWKPEGTVAEGDVLQRMHSDTTPLGDYWQGWDGALNPQTAFAPLDDFLSERRADAS